MPRETLRDVAAALVAQVLDFEQPMERVVGTFVRARPALGSRERRLLGDVAYEVVRHLARYRFLADNVAGDGDEARRLVDLAWPGAPARVDPPPLPDAVRHGLPPWLATRLERQLGSEFLAWVDSIDRPAPVDLRANRIKATPDDVLASLRGAGIDAVPTPHSPLGVRVAEHRDLTRLPALADGLAEVQDEGSQLLVLALGAKRGETVVDYCAGAGGKTLAIGAQMRGSGRVVAFDVSAARLAQLAPRLAASGLENVHTSAISGAGDERVGRLVGKADRVLVDAPCTGLGTLRRHPDLKWRQNEATLAAFGVEQRAILASAARLVKPGGTLVYATCSVLVEENQAVAADFDRDHASRLGFARAPAAEALARARVTGAETLVDGDDLSLWTHRHGTDGFYAALWRRAR